MQLSIRHHLVEESSSRNTYQHMQRYRDVMIEILRAFRQEKTQNMPTGFIFMQAGVCYDVNKYRHATFAINKNSARQISLSHTCVSLFNAMSIEQSFWAVYPPPNHMWRISGVCKKIGIMIVFMKTRK